MKELEQHHKDIIALRDQGKTPGEIAIHIYNVMCQNFRVDGRYKEVDIRFITTLVNQYLEERATFAAEQLAREQRNREREQVALEIEAMRQEINRKARRRHQQAKAKREAAERLAAQEAEQRRAVLRERRERLSAKVPKWHGRDWNDILPPTVATRQAAWERQMAALHMKEAGFRITHIGYRLGISPSRVAEILHKAQRHRRRSPIEIYLAETINPAIKNQQHRRRLLMAVEAWTGQQSAPHVLRCPDTERQVWETYYQTRADV